MNKKAQSRAIWPLVYNKIKNPPPGINFGDLPGRMPPMNKIVLDSGAPGGDSNAFGYVSTEDVDHNGTIDTMHIVVPNLDKHLSGISPQDLDSSNPQRMYEILAPIVELIAHEMGHQKDYKHEEEDPFPGGETVADQAGQRALNQISVQATNNLNKNDTTRSFIMKKEIISRLVELSGDLDKKGEYKLSDEVTTLAEKFAQENLWEQSARNFSTATNLAPGPNLDGVAKVQQQLLDMGYDIGSRSGGPDKLWGPKTTEAYRLFTRKYQSMLEGLGHSPERVAKELESLMTSPDADDLARKMKSISRLMKFQGAAQEAGESAPDEAEVDSRKPISFTPEQEQNIREVHESAPSGEELDRMFDETHPMSTEPNQFRNKADDGEDAKADDKESCAADLQPGSADEEDEKEAEAKNVNDLTKNASFNAVFWKQNVKTPFGR